MSVSICELEYTPDPNTPQWMLPRHMRRGDNSCEEACRRKERRFSQSKSATLGV